MTDANRLALIIMGPLCLLIGVGIIIYAGKRMWFFLESRGWLRAAGVVTRSEVRAVDTDGSDYFAPHVEYAFEVEGRSFTGTKLKFGFLTELFDTRPEAEERTSMFPVGATVSVLYPPRRPSECVLERKLERGMFAFFLAGIVFAGFAVRMILEAISR